MLAWQRLADKEKSFCTRKKGSSAVSEGEDSCLILFCPVGMWSWCMAQMLLQLGELEGCRWGVGECKPSIWLGRLNPQVRMVAGCQKFWHGTNPGLFKCVLQKLCKERHLHPCPLQLFSSMQVFAQSRPSPASGPGRAKLELTLTLFVQRTEYDYSLLSLSFSFNSLSSTKIKVTFRFLSCIRETSSWKCHENWYAPMKNVDFDDSAFSHGR